MSINTNVVCLLIAATVIGAVAPAFAGGGVVQAADEEPNDDFETAEAISEGDISGEITNGESDFFTLDANTTDALDVEIVSADALDDLALRVYDADRDRLVADGNAFDGIDATVKLPETGTYYIEVVGQSQEITSSYTLNVDVVTPAENDQFAPNDDFESATPISEGVSDARIVGGESDFYQFEANTTDALDVEIVSADALDDLALRVYDADRDRLVADGNAFDGIDATVKLPETGTYYVEVIGQSQETTSNYTLNFDIITPAENDQFAPNDDFESAAPISEGFTDARIIGGEADFYRFEANTTDAASVDISSADALDDLALRVYDADRDRLVADGNEFDGIDATVKLPETGTYYVEVVGQSQETTSNYTLNFDIITPAENDQFAPNDDFESAAPISEEFTDARIVGGESDYYAITLNESEYVRSEIRTAASVSDLILRLYAPDQTEVASDGNEFNGLEVTHQAATGGTYYLEVAGQSQETTSTYELQSNQTFINSMTVQIANVALDPNQVAPATTNSHTLTFDVADVSDDGNTDRFEITLPDDTLESLDDASVTDTSGTNISIETDDISGDTIIIEVAPDSSATTREVTVTATATVTAPDSTTTADIAVVVTDSNNGADSATVPLTVSDAGAPGNVPDGWSENGLSADLFDAVDSDNDGTVDRDEVRTLVSRFVRQGEINGVGLERTSVRSTVEFFIRN